MQTIWKYPVVMGQFLPDGYTTLDVPHSATFLCVQLQDDDPCFWYLVDPKAPKRPRTIHLVGTGNGFPQDADLDRYLGTVQKAGYVWHFFEGAR